MTIRDMWKGATVAALILAPLPVLAADAGGEITTAATHADLASKAGAIAMTQMHLHHALNCVVGPSGAGFDAKSLNPCANSGAGAIPDTADAGKKAKLEAVATTLRAGLATSDEAVAQKDAADAAKALTALK